MWSTETLQSQDMSELDRLYEINIKRLEESIEKEHIFLWQFGAFYAIGRSAFGEGEGCNRQREHCSIASSSK